MTAATSDTLTAARELDHTGIERQQASAIAGTVHGASAAGRDDLVTKADLDVTVAGLETRVRTDLAAKSHGDAATASVCAGRATIRSAIGTLAAFVFAVGLRVFGIL